MKLFYSTPLFIGLQISRFDPFCLEMFVLIVQPLQFHDSMDRYREHTVPSRIRRAP